MDRQFVGGGLSDSDVLGVCSIAGTRISGFDHCGPMDRIWRIEGSNVIDDNAVLMILSFHGEVAQHSFGGDD